jgi:MFS family permease
MPPTPLRLTPKRTIWAGLTYFALVFGVGFILGPIRILLIAPRLGERIAELCEAPVMLLVIVFAARWVVRRFRLPRRTIHRLTVGLLALALALLFEFTLVLQLRELTLSEYFRTRDPVSGSVYYLTLVLFAVMPLLVERNGAVARRREECRV